MLHEINSKSQLAVGQLSSSLQPVKPTFEDAVSNNSNKTIVAIIKAEINVDPVELQKNLSQSIERLNKLMLQNGRNLSFSIDPSLEIPIITVKNEETGEVVRQIPTQAVVQVAHNFDALKGILLNAKI